MVRARYLVILVLNSLVALYCGTCRAQSEAPPVSASAPEAASSAHTLLQLGPGDEVKIDVFDRPEMGTSTYVSDDGTIRVPLAGAVQVVDLSPAEAARKVESALKAGEYLVDPHVTITLVVSRSQRISVLGEVRTPGRYVIDADTSILDLLAQAGGATEKSADVIYILRHSADGGVERIPVNLRDVARGSGPSGSTNIHLQGGDSLFVPTATTFFISGEVRTPGEYRLDPGMTVVQAIARAGGLTDKGSSRHTRITRRTPDGHNTLSAGPDEPVRPDDIIVVKERIF